MSDKSPGEKLGRSSCSNSMCFDKTIGCEDEKTDAGSLFVFFYCHVKSFVIYFKTAIHIYIGCLMYVF